MPTTRQVTFEAGELAQKLWGRTDSPLYGKGTRTCRNFFPTLEGQLVSRPGSTYVTETRGSATAHAFPGSAANTKVRLIKFIFGQGQTYVLELGDRYMRFMTNGGVIESSPGVPLQIVTPWNWSSLPSLQFAQVGNIMVLTQAGYDAQVLERIDNVTWTLGPQSYTPPSWPGLAYTPAAVNPFAPPGSPLVVTMMSDPMLETPMFPADSDHPAVEWQYALTLLGQNTKTGKTFETLPFVVTQSYDGADTYPLPNGSVADLASNLLVLYPDCPIVISAYRTFNLGTPPDFFIKSLIIYRGRGGLWGFLGTTLDKKFVDIGREPNYAQPPPMGTNPFVVLWPDKSVQRIEKPMAVAFYQDRLTFGGAYDNDKLIRVGTMFFSATGRWSQFDQYLIPVDTMSLQFELAVTQRQEIRVLHPAQKLLIGTDTAIQSIWGAGGAPLAASVIPDVRTEAPIGCSHLRMLDVKGVALFAEGGQPDFFGSDCFAAGMAVHSLTFSGRYGTYSNSELSAQASHLFYGDGGGLEHAIIDWDYAAKPWQLVWAVRADGVMLSLTFNPGNGHSGWARHDTDGVYENVCTVPEGLETAVYTVVRRTVAGETRRYIERMTSRSLLNQGGAFSPFGGYGVPDDICLDSAQSYTGAPTTLLSGLGHLNGKSVWVLRYGLPPLGPYTVNGDFIYIDSPTPAAGRTYVGLLYRPEMETLDVAGPRERQKILRGLLLEVKDTRGLRVGKSLDPDDLKPVRQNTVAIGYGTIPDQTRTIRVATTGEWDEGARAAVVQDLPLPCTIVGLTRDVSMGDGSQP